MKITKLAYRNFLGTEALEDVPGKVNVLLAGNGAGKSTYIKALRFAVTGELPNGEVIRNGADSLYTFAEVEGNTIERIKGETTKTMLNCRSATKKSIDEFYCSMGINPETARVLTSSQVLGNMNAEELSRFILESGLIPVAVDIDKLVSICRPDTADVEKEMRSYFPAAPELIYIDDIAEAYSSYYGGRRSISADLKVSKAKCSGFTFLKPPVKTVEDVDREISEYEKLFDRKIIEDYNEAITRTEQINEQIAEMEAQISKNNATEPDPDSYKALAAEREHLTELLNAKNQTIAVLMNTISNSENTLKALSESICPLHNEIICTADKSALIGKLKGTLSTARTELAAIEDEVSVLEGKIAELTQKIDEYNDNQGLYEDKLILLKHIEMLRSSFPTIPDKPAISEEEIAEANDKLMRLRDYRKYIISYNEQREEYEKMQTLSCEYERYDAMVELLSPKSGIQEAVLGMAVDTIVQECNKTASELGLSITLAIKADKGLRVLANTNDSGYYDFNSLSNGEKVVVELLIMDVLNKLSGFNILVLDNLDSLDTNAFSKVLSLATSSGFSERYDHIFLAGVDHPDLLEEIKKYDVHHIKI